MTAMRGCCTWARYYDPQVGRFISRDAVLSEHPYLYCEHEPVDYVDPSGNIPQWVKDYAKAAWEWTREHASDIRKGIGVVAGTLIGIKLAEEIYNNFMDWDTSNSMRDMLEDWKPKHPAKVDWDLNNRVRNQHIQDAMRNVGQAVGDVAERIYKVRPSR